jgi:very-short-patch-repair endonuclease
MHIYANYVFPDKLISPVTGYECRIITKQTIKHFGFNSKEELQHTYPGFPLCCDELRKLRSNNYFDPNPVRYTDVKQKYELNPNRCIRCNSTLNYENRGNKFCNQSCSAVYNNRHRSQKTYDKQRTSLLNTIAKKPKIVKAPKEKILKTNICKICNETFETFGNPKSCSKKCKSILLSVAGRKSASIRITRSKDEIKLFNLCSTAYDCIPNHIIADGWDADIVIPAQKIAILWNGPWHYKQMPHKNHSLLQVQTRDQIKTKLFESLGWRVLIFEDRYHTPETAFEQVLLVI